MIQFTIPIDPVTKKNSQRIIQFGGKPRIIPSKKYSDYEKEALWFIPTIKKPIDYPVNIKCIFYVPTKRRYDLTNLLEAIDDVMVKAKLIEDDNYNIIASHDGSRVIYDKGKGRTEVVIEGGVT